jgi:hypothetical protein
MSSKSHIDKKKVAHSTSPTSTETTETTATTTTGIY